MKRLICILAGALAGVGVALAPPSDVPQFNADGQLTRPQDYREWIYLSSGLGMTYGPLGTQAQPEHPFFDNVFASPSAYQGFLATGKWPDKTMLVLEIRSSQSKGSINRGGHFQDEVRGVEIEVKDEKRFPGKWAFFGFDKGINTARQIPASAACYSCHLANGAVDNTFVQFYPTLLPIAKAKGTIALFKDGTASLPSSNSPHPPRSPAP